MDDSSETVPRTRCVHGGVCRRRRTLVGAQLENLKVFFGGALDAVRQIQLQASVALTLVVHVGG